MKQTIEFFHHESDRTGLESWYKAEILDEMPKIGDKLVLMVITEINERTWFAQRGQDAYDIYEVKGPEADLYKLRDGIDPAPIFGGKQPRCVDDDEIDKLTEKLGRPDLYKDFTEADADDLIRIGFDQSLICSRFVAIEQQLEEENVEFIDIVGRHDTGILIWKNPNANLFCGGRWEITVTYWYHMKHDTEIQCGDEIFRFDAPHETTEVENLTDYLTNDNGELWASVEVDDDDDIPRLLEAHMPGTVHDYGNLVIVLPDEWN